MQVDPEHGTVGFGSGLHGWGFTVQKFANMYASKFGISRQKMMQKLWGDNYFDQTTKKWYVSNTTTHDMHIHTPRACKILSQATCH